MIFYPHECEELIGYNFKNLELLRACFTHASYSNEHNGTKNNERLEFLGDSVLGLVVAEYLFARAKEDEGTMTTQKQKYVSTKPLSLATRRLGIEKFLLVNQGSVGGVITDKLCENLFESVIAGIYLDGGYEEAKKFIFKNLLQVKSVSKTAQKKEVDNKSKLQIILQRKYKNDFRLEYKEVSRQGPPHKPVYTMSVVLNGNAMAQGQGNSKKEASEVAAGKVIKILNTKKSKRVNK